MYDMCQYLLYMTIIKNQKFLFQLVCHENVDSPENLDISKPEVLASCILKTWSQNIV